MSRKIIAYENYYKDFFDTLDKGTQEKGLYGLDVYKRQGIFHTGIQRTVGGGKQVAFDSRFLCGNGKGAAEQKTRKDIPGFHVFRPSFSRRL